MDSRQLLHIAAIVECGSLTKAAKSLHMTQPALSKAVEKLEAELKHKIFERGPRGVLPTTFGRMLYAHARSIRSELDLTVEEIHKFPQEDFTTLTIGTLPTLAGSIVATAIGRWRSRYPNGVIRLIEKVSSELIAGLIRAEYDFVVSQLEGDDFSRDLKRRVLFRDRLYVVARPGHLLFKKSNISREDLAEFPWIYPSVGNRQGNVLERFIRSGGVLPPRQRVECGGSIEFIRSLIAASDHLALLPAWSLDPGDKDVRPLPITFSSLNRDIVLVYREYSPLSQASKDLASHIAEIGKEKSRKQPAYATFAKIKQQSI